LSVKKDFDLGTIVTVSVLLATNFGVVLWWASEMNTKLDTIIVEAERAATAQEAEDFRQWARINTLESQLSSVLVIERTLSLQMDNLSVDIDATQTQLRDHSALMRDLIATVAALEERVR
jgi:hypothetical protein